VHVGWFNSFTVDYLRVSHTKTRANLLFTNIATALARKDYVNHLYIIAWFFNYYFLY
jgi:hypothetical protein